MDQSPAKSNSFLFHTSVFSLLKPWINGLSTIEVRCPIEKKTFMEAMLGILILCLVDFQTMYLLVSRDKIGEEKKKMAGTKTSLKPACSDKSMLFEYARELGIDMPSFLFVSEGEPHIPKFRATVLFDGVKYTSTETYPRLKEAEHAVARTALTKTKKRRGECTIKMLEDSRSLKSILNEFSVPLKCPKPTYKIAVSDGQFLGFISTVVFNGMSYTHGNACKSKLEAEQMAARAAIFSYLASPEEECLLKLVEGKRKLVIDNDRFGTVSEACGLMAGSQQSVANTALRKVKQKIIEEGASTILKDKRLVKSILHEFTVQLNCNKPVYTTSLTEERRYPTFISTLDFNGETYVGAAARTKKEAEQLAAHAAIISHFGSPYEESLLEVIHSKAKLV